MVAATTGHPSLPALEAQVGKAIVARNLVLRKPLMSDAAALAQLANDRSVAEMTARIPHPYTLDDANDFLADTLASGQHGHLRFAITAKLPSGQTDEVASGEFMGMVAVDRVDGNLVLGYWLGRPFRRRGYMSEAAEALVNALFETGEVPHIISSARMINDGSRAILEGLGFQRTGVGLIRSTSLKGSVPVTHYKLTPADFARRPRQL
ncbi:MAG: GNAT family N-acetyltransferase [Pseudomonadota bacterium]